MNCHLQIFYAPNDNDTGKYAEQLLGNETIEVESQSDSGGIRLLSKTNYSRSQTGRALMTADELKRLGDQEIIIASGSPPVLTDKIKYYENKFYTTDKEHNANPKRDALLAALKAGRKKATQKAENSPSLTYNPLEKDRESEKSPSPAQPATFYRTLQPEDPAIQEPPSERRSSHGSASQRPPATEDSKPN